MTQRTFLDGLGGTVRGSFFQAESTVDLSKPPGTTTVQAPQTLGECVVPILSGQGFVYSPNLSWFILACFFWLVWPYDLGANKSWVDHLMERLVINHLLVFGYVGFWYIALYYLEWGERPFCTDRKHSIEKVWHNMFYTWLGTVQWTLTEIAIIHCYETGKISFPKETLTEDPKLGMTTLVIAILIPNFRDVHFYFAHRLIHSRFLYEKIHCVHHRNTDVEPFSGLCMHPLEHALYFTSYSPCLMGGVHPFILFWVGVHSLIAPAASHSGFEDHFSADVVHYIHHRYRDCNYGVPQAIPLDVWFGTFRGQAGSAFKPSSDPKAKLGIPRDHFLFNFSWILLCVGISSQHESMPTILAASLITIGPLFLAYLSVWWNGGASTTQRSVIAPFDKDPWWSQVLHFGLGTVLSVLPATYLVYMILVS